MSFKTPEEILAGKPHKTSKSIAPKPHYHERIVINAMHEYAAQFIPAPSSCYNCNGSVFNTPCVTCTGTGKIIVLPPIQSPTCSSLNQFTFNTSPK